MVSLAPDDRQLRGGRSRFVVLLQALLDVLERAAHGLEAAIDGRGNSSRLCPSRRSSSTRRCNGSSRPMISSGGLSQTPTHVETGPEET
jgi:hypothetical protein